MRRRRPVACLAAMTAVLTAATVVLSGVSWRSAAAQIRLVQPPGRRCGPSATPAQLPPLAYVIDVPGLRSSVGRVPEGSVIFAASFGTTGYAELPVAVTTTFSAELTQTLATALMNAMRDQPAGAWTLLVRLESASPLRVEIDRSVFCHAEIADGVQELDAWLKTRGVSGKRLDSWQLAVELRLDSLGHALGAKVLGPAPYSSLAGIDSAVVRNTFFFAPWQDGRYVTRVDTVTFGKGSVPR